jgi:outer membrane protein assembly factor BamB
MRSALALLLFSLVLVAPAAADDWPQYRGPNRDDVSRETGLLDEWPKEGPQLLWTYSEAGIGYSGPAVAGDRYYTIGGRGDKEYLLALGLPSAGGSGGEVKQAWAVEIGPLFAWEGNRWSAGPSSTPTVDGELIYALGGNGDLVCVAAASGDVKWRKNLPSELAAEVNPIGGGPKKLGWGFTWSPLVDGDQLICLPGGPQGTVAALNKQTGEVLWRSSELIDQAAYTSPMLAEIDGVRQIVVLTNQGISGVSASDGQLLWQHKRPRRYSTEVINTPIVRGNLVYVTVGAGQGCELVRVQRKEGQFETESVYDNKNMTNHHGNVVLVKDHVFGFSEGKGWMCQNFETGEVAWTERGKLRAGSLTYADGNLYCYSEDNGTCVLLAADTTGWREKGRFQIPQQTKQRKPGGKIWTPPVVANGRLYLRDQELVFCFEVSDREGK